MKRLALITFILGTALVAAPIAGAVVAMPDTGGSSGSASVAMSKADLARGAALNAKYGNAVTNLSPSAFASLYNNGGDRLSPQELAALVARSQGIERWYGIAGVNLKPDILGGDGTSATPASGGSSFDWNTALGATLGGMLLLAAAAAVVTRRRHQLSF